MADALSPECGRWYKRRDDGNSFEVLFVDADDGDVEIRYFDGAIEMLDLPSWYQLRLTRREPPQRLREGFGRLAEIAALPSGSPPATRWTGPLDWSGSDD